MDIAGGWYRYAAALPVWAARALIYFLLQGAGLLAIYATLGFDTSPDAMPLGQKLDPVHAAVHAIWGAAATYVGFFRPRYATGFMIVFALFYIALALVGTLTQHHFGMRLGFGENLFHWLVGPLALLVAVLGWLGARGQPALR